MSESNEEFVERAFGYIKLRTKDFVRLKTLALRGAAISDMADVYIPAMKKRIKEDNRD